MKRKIIFDFELCITYSGVFKQGKDNFSDVFLKLGVCWGQMVMWLKYWKIAPITDLTNGKSLVVFYTPQAFSFCREV